MVTIASISAQNKLPRDKDGWTIFTPHTTARIVYVSSSGGDDATGKYYTVTSTEIGKNPFDPSDSIKPFKTINAAYKATRNLQPDWILLKKDDVWFESLQARSGLSDDAPFLVSSYGKGVKRPLLKTGAKGGVSYCCKNFNNAAIVDIDFYAHTRNLSSSEFVDQEGESGFNFYVGEGYVGKGILIEGCRFRFYTNNIVQGPGTLEDIVIRRSVILDNYSSSAHSQGLYSSNASLTLEENIFDHNGWYKQQIKSGANEKTDGQATMFNHNTYFAASHNVTFRGNIFLRASSIGNKWTANDGEASAKYITIDNNLYVEGEIGISIGGNESVPPYRFKGISITNNVMLDIGRGQPTNRTLGWGLEINDWDSGLVSKNYFLHRTNPVVNNVYAINLIGQTRNVRIDSNLIYGLGVNSNCMSVDSGTTKKDIIISNNTIHNVSTSGKAVKVTGAIDNYVFAGNRYFCKGNVNGWFAIDKTVLNTKTWIEKSGEKNLIDKEMTYTDPDRTIITYMKKFGKENGLDGFIQEVREQCKSNWRKEFTAAEVNKWIKDGFTAGVSTDIRKSELNKKFNAKADYTSESFAVFDLNGKLLGVYKYKELLKSKLSKGVLVFRPADENYMKIPASTLVGIDNR